METDDIVTQLRDVAPHAKAANPLSVDPFLWSLTGLMNGAAHEIECLRREVDVWRGICERFAESDPRFDAFRFYFMAVRGE